MRDARRFAILVFIGTALVQAAWIMAVPPYRGIDEFDHAYRAAGVARGQWILTEEVPNGRGLAVGVPVGMVTAAEEQCESLLYTEFGNCHPVEYLDNGDVVVATAAGSYNPLYYAVIGYSAKPFDGPAANYAMRIVSALLCALGIALAAYCLGIMRAGPWIRLGFIISMTPSLFYTSSLPAPNSVEIVAALVTWCALLAVFSGKLEVGTERRLVWLAGVFAALTVLPRQLGPLWLFLIGVLLVGFVGWDKFSKVIRRHCRPVIVSSCAVVVVSAISVGWSAWSGFYSESADVPPGTETPEIKPAWVIVWTLQIIGAFPFRKIPAPTPVYIFYLIVLLPFLAIALKRAPLRQRWVLLGAVALTLLLPFALTFATVSSHGVVWQGRYQLPVVIGIGLLAGSILDERRPGRLSTDAAVVAVLLFGGAQAWSVFGVHRIETARADVGLDPSWLTLPGGVLISMVLIGVVCMSLIPILQVRSQNAGRGGSHSPPLAVGSHGPVS